MPTLPRTGSPQPVGWSSVGALPTKMGSGSPEDLVLFRGPPGLGPCVCCERPKEEEEVQEGERRVPWELSPPLGLRGSERQAAQALASLPRPGLPAWLRGEGACRRCVVVGSGGVLHGSHLGSFIDQYDVIIWWELEREV